MNRTPLISTLMLAMSIPGVAGANIAPKTSDIRPLGARAASTLRHFVNTHPHLMSGFETGAFRAAIGLAGAAVLFTPVLIADQLNAFGVPHERTVTVDRTHTRDVPKGRTIYLVDVRDRAGNGSTWTTNRGTRDKLELLRPAELVTLRTHDHLLLPESIEGVLPAAPAQ